MAMSKKDATKYKKLLHAKRAVLQGDAEALESEALEHSMTDESGANSNMPVHFADLGTDSYEQGFAIERLENKEEIIRMIDDALEKFDTKEFGSCEECGVAIKRTRLNALPWAKYCLKCQSDFEENGDFDQD